MGPLFELLSNILSEDWVNDTLSQEESLVQPSLSPSEVNHDTICHIQQTLLIILEDFITSLDGSPQLKAYFYSPSLEVLIHILFCLPIYYLLTLNSFLLLFTG